MGILYLFDAHPITGSWNDSGGVVDMLFVPLVITLAIGLGSLPRLLSTRLMVYGGQISFCLYMVHELVHTSLGMGRAAIRAHTAGQSRGNGTLSACSRSLWSLSILMYHFVEEPARRWMRRMVDARAADAKVEPGEPIDTKLHQIDGGQEAVSVRAV